MEFDLDDIIQSIIDNFCESNIDYDFEDILDSLMDQGIDLTQFTVEEIKEALDSALDADSQAAVGTSEYHVTFGAKHFDGFIDKNETITLKHAGSSGTETFDVYKEGQLLDLTEKGDFENFILHLLPPNLFR